jgi:serine phosphatase RsbU (regulator of sigma subunit)
VAPKLDDRGVFVALLGYVVVVSAMDAVLQDAFLRLAPVTMLAPFVAGALLSFRQTMVISAVFLVLTGIQYGLWQPGISTPNRAAIIASAAAVCLVSLAVCHVRVGREERINRLRLTAGAAQRLLLRSLPLPAGDVLVDGFYVAAEEETLVGGDIYEVLSTPFGTRMVICDVRGKGLGAIGASAAVLTAFREAAHQKAALPAVIDRMEQALLRYERTAGGELRDEEFVTALVVETMGPESLRVIDCGHLSPIVVSGGEVSEVALNEPGLPLGMGDLTEIPRRWQDIKVPIGGRMLMYTDGVIEARNGDGEFYPLVDRLHGWLPLPTDELLEQLRTDLNQHAGGFLQDDAALLIVQR